MCHMRAQCMTLTQLHTAIFHIHTLDSCQSHTDEDLFPFPNTATHESQPIPAGNTKHTSQEQLGAFPNGKISSRSFWGYHAVLGQCWPPPPVSASQPGWNYCDQNCTLFTLQVASHLRAMSLQREEVAVAKEARFKTRGR